MDSWGGCTRQNAEGVDGGERGGHLHGAFYHKKRHNSIMTPITSRLCGVNHSRRGCVILTFDTGRLANGSQWQQQVSVCALARVRVRGPESGCCSATDVAPWRQRAAPDCRCRCSALRHVFVIQSLPSESGDLQNTEGGVGERRGGSTGRRRRVRGSMRRRSGGVCLCLIGCYCGLWLLFIWYSRKQRRIAYCNYRVSCNERCMIRTENVITIYKFVKRYFRYFWHYAFFHPYQNKCFSIHDISIYLFIYF